VQKKVYVSEESAYLRLVKYGSRSSLKAWVKAWRIALHPRTMGLIWLGFSRADVRLIPCLYALLHIRLLPVVHESAGRHSGFSSGGTL